MKYVIKAMDPRKLYTEENGDFVTFSTVTPKIKGVEQEVITAGSGNLPFFTKNHKLAVKTCIELNRKNIKTMLIDGNRYPNSWWMVEEE